ncbi:hypothetical protein MAPG_02413 [Magnaporthiopsis poae ATCC 64411]|uniref:Uncharacterized protein n=1 Tax=Magnaporthiopsis poae (strain ATCC 64411 / 73-15) TaxID=644358 RepID=A0A0C4DRA5_MAGP6|nr:hypothetical protein MAPG_02413 [Magnaporthiopsis poae ATCC 64411]
MEAVLWVPFASGASQAAPGSSAPLTRRSHFMAVFYLPGYFQRPSDNTSYLTGLRQLKLATIPFFVADVSQGNFGRLATGGDQPACLPACPPACLNGGLLGDWAKS